MIATPEILSNRQFTPELETLNTNYVRQLISIDDKYSLEELIVMLRVCPVNRVAIDLKALRASTALGKYCHSDTDAINTASGKQTIQEWMRGNFDSMRGNLRDVSSKMMRQAYALGFCSGEIIWKKQHAGNRSEWRLGKVNILNPLTYSFAGEKGRVDRIIYNSLYHAPTAVPYAKLLHVYSPSVEEPDDPRGDAQATRAYPFYRSRQITFEQWTQAGQRQATGLLVVKEDPAKQVGILDRYGKPLVNTDGSAKTQPALYAAVKAAAETGNGSVLGVDKDVDVTSIPGNAGENFFNVKLTHYQKMIFYSYGIPSTIFDDTASGIGNSGINAGHKLILDNQLESIVDNMREEIIEKIVRPLLLANFGTRYEDNLGEFKSDKFVDPTLAGTRVSNLIIAFNSGFLDSTDLEAINRLREDLGISPLSREQFDDQQLAKLLAQQERQAAPAQ